MTRNNEELRQQHKALYLEGRVSYASAIKKHKITSWNKYCNLTSSANPWNEVYKIDAEKRKKHTTNYTA